MKWIVVAAALGGVALGLGAGYARWNGLFPGYIHGRQLMLERQAEQIPQGRTVLIGDSVTEQVFVDDLCGGTLNAAISRSASDNALELARVILPRIRPKRLIVEVGSNDSISLLSSDDFRRNVEVIITLAPQARLVLFGVPRDPRLSAIVAEIARRHEALYVDPPKGPALTIDGTHPNAAGRRLWRQEIARSCQ